MKITKLWEWELSTKINGIAVIVDTFAATTNLSIILSKNPKHLIIISNNNLNKAKEIYPEGIVVGESFTLPQNTFTYSNFPSDLIKGDFLGKTVLYMSQNGTRVVEKVWALDNQTIGCAFNNLNAVVNYIKNQNEENITIVMSGDNGSKVLEDQVCAEILEKELLREDYNWDKLSAEVSDFIKSYYIQARGDDEGLKLTLSLNQYNIVPKVFKNKLGFLEIKKI